MAIGQEVSNMRNVIILLVLVVLSACNSPSDREPLTLDQVVASFEDEGLQLQAADANPASIVQRGINDVRPTSYLLGDKDTLYLFIFNSEADRQQGKDDFYNRPIDFVAHATYEENNVLVLWFYEESPDDDTDARIRAALARLERMQ
jgi:hypothetical protein